MTTIVPKLKQPNELLNHILDHPELSSVIQSLDAGVLTKLIRHVGLEDSGEIVSMATVEQLKRVFDEDLWYSEAPGREEVFDADRFGLWLEIMLETGPAFAARKIMELDEDLVIMALCRIVLVVDLDELTLRMSNSKRLPEDDMLDKILESTLNQEFDAYLVIAKNHSRWGAVQTLLAELNELDYAMLNRLLERCCRISCEYIEDNGGLFDVLTAEEMLEVDMAAEREARRESKGFVSAATAVSFLNLARTTALKKIIAAKTIDPSTRAYLKATGAETDIASKPRKTVEPSENAHLKRLTLKLVRFLKTLQTAEVLPAPDQKRLSYANGSMDHHLPLAKAMRFINRTDPALYSLRLMELTYLSNILISGCRFQGRTFRPVEAGEAAFSVCNLGSEYLLGAEVGAEENQSVESMTALLIEYHLVKLFQVGWKLLNDNVVFYSAKAVLGFFDRLKDDLSDPQQDHEISRMAEIMRSCVLAGRPWEFDDQLDQLLVFLDSKTAMALTALLQEYPTISEVISKQGQNHLSPFIWSRTHIRTIQKFIKDVL